MYKGTVSISPFMCELGSSQRGSVYFQLLRLSSERVLYAFSMYRSSSSTPGCFREQPFYPASACYLHGSIFFVLLTSPKLTKQLLLTICYIKRLLLSTNIKKFDAFAISTERSRTMKKRTNTAFWVEKEKRWCIAVQKNGTRKRFYSSTPGRTGQREANAKADAWLDDSIRDGKKEGQRPLFRVGGRAEAHLWHILCYAMQALRGLLYILPTCGNIRIDELTEGDLQRQSTFRFGSDPRRRTSASRFQTSH